MEAKSKGGNDEPDDIYPTPPNIRATAAATSADDSMLTGGAGRGRGR